MLWYERYSPGRLVVTGATVLFGLYLFGLFGKPPCGPVAAFFIAITAIYFAWAWLGPLVDEQLLFRNQRRLLRGLREAAEFADEMRRVGHKRRKRLDEAARGAVEEAVVGLDRAVASRDEAKLLAALKEADRVAEQHLRLSKKGVLRDFTETIGGALFIALLLRVFVIEAFKIPSGSMIPTLEIGDHIFVNKFSYGVALPRILQPGQVRVIGFAPPKPGDVVVFIAPEPAENAGEDFIKRVVAVAGQRVRVEGGTLFVDDVEQARGGGEAYGYEEYIEGLGMAQRFHATRYSETTGGVPHSVLLTHLVGNEWPPPGLALNGIECDARECRVAPGYVFCMGDNRDNSSDSRRWGAVPTDNVKGRAMFVWLSFGNAARDAGFLGMRWGRIGTWIK